MVCKARGAAWSGGIALNIITGGAMSIDEILTENAEDHDGEVRAHTWPVPVLPTAPRRRHIGRMVDQRQRVITTLSIKPAATAELGMAHQDLWHATVSEEPAGR